MNDFSWMVAAFAFMIAAPIMPAHAEDGAELYATYCAACHDGGVDRALPREEFEAMSPEVVLSAMEAGSMIGMAVRLSSAQRRELSEYLTQKSFSENRPVITAAAAVCGDDAPSFTLDGPRWSGWGPTGSNARYQAPAAAGMTAADLPRLKLKWAFAFPGDLRAYGHPALVGGRLYTGSQGGRVYSLDAESGCIHWSFDAGAGVRSAVTIAGIETASGPRAVAMFGDQNAFVHALDAETGEPLWKTRVDELPVARITGSPVLSRGRLFVPVASSEESAAAVADYECCTFRGSLVALDASTGELLWKTYTVDAPQPTVKNAIGVQLWGPSGAPIWSSPAIDAQRNAVYVTTGNNYSEPTTHLSDAFVAMDIDSGEILWSKQMTSADAYTAACRLEDKTNCAESDGPDFDFGASPILVDLPSGRRALIAGQKSGVVHALDPDSNGEIVWQTRVGRGGSMGGVQWGSAADDSNVYVALSDIGRVAVPHSWATEADPSVGGGMFALRLTDGKRVWYTPPASCGSRSRCSPAQLAAVTAIEGAAFSGSLDGHLRAYSSVDGTVLWDFDTIRAYEAVNGVPGRGGSLDGAGPVIGGGMLFVNSGYPHGGGAPGNVLLAFSLVPE